MLDLARANLAFTSPKSRPFFDDLTLSTLCFTSSTPPLSVSRESNQNIQVELELRTKQRITIVDVLNSVSPRFELSNIPKSAVSAMLRIYTTSLMHHYPVIDRGIIQRIYQTIYQSDIALILSNLDHFILYMIFAISSVTLAWKGRQQAHALSVSFLMSALRHLRRAPDVEGLSRLQVVLLLAHYSQLNPEVVDNWACVNSAVRIALDQGLPFIHPSTLTQDQREVRCILLMTIYNHCRSLSSMLRLPLSFPEESIAFNPAEELSLPNQSTAGHIFKYRRIEIEVHRVLHLLDDTPQLNAKGFDKWLSDIKEALEEWYVLSNNTEPADSFTFRHTMYFYLKAKIHRPTPRLPNRSISEQRVCFDVCINIIESVKGLLDSHHLVYIWQVTHILFGAAILLLNACWEGRNRPSMNQSATQVLQHVIPSCLEILDTIGVTWKHSRTCALYIRPILDEVARPYGLSITLDSPPPVDELMTSERLRALLFADRPPRDNVQENLSPPEPDFELFETLHLDWDNMDFDLNWDF